MKNLSVTVFERIIIESILNGSKTLSQLHKQTGLKPHVNFHSIKSLLKKGILEEDQGEFHIIISNAFLIKILNNSYNKISEVNYLHNKALDKTLFEKKSFFKLKRVSISEKDEKILQAHLNNLENFLSSLKNNSYEKSKLVYWCSADMNELLEDIA